MNVTDKTCNICLKICDKTFSVISYESFFTNVLGHKDLKISFTCLWCTVTLQKTIKFLNFIKSSQNILKRSEVKENNPHLSTLTIHRNKSIDINPFDEICLTQNCSMEESAVVNENAEKEVDTAICNNHSLKVHIQSVHKMEKKFICEYCKDNFSTKQRLTVHIRSHTGVRPFKCDICNKKFTTSSNLKSHQITHSKRKDYYCVECNTLYKSEKSLKKHFKESKKHVRDCEKRYLCTVCSKQFSTEPSLSSHLKERHLASHECNICNKKFSSNSNLKKHIRCIHGSKESCDV